MIEWLDIKAAINYVIVAVLLLIYSNKQRFISREYKKFTKLTNPIELWRQCLQGSGSSSLTVSTGGSFFFWHVFAFFSMCCEVLDLDKFAVDNFKFLLKNLICDRLGKLWT